MDSKATTPDSVIVVGVDGSVGAERATRWAALEAMRISATLRIVNAWAVPALAYPAEIGAVYLDPGVFKDAASSIVERAALSVRRDLHTPTLVLETSTVRGGAVEELLAAADRASLLVVGSRGRGGFASLVLGSVAATCAHHSSTPVAVIGNETPAPGTGDVVVGVDDSVGGHAALRWAVAEAGRLGVTVRAVHGWNLPGIAPDGALAAQSTLQPDLVEAARHGVQRMVDAVIADVVDPPIVEVVAVALPASEALIREAKSAALLVVGSRGRGGFAGLLLGSVSQQCLHHSPCPLVIVPAGARR